MPLALIPSTFEELAIALGVLAIGWLLVLLGNLGFGAKKEGGKRLVLFTCGCSIAAMALIMCRQFWPAFTAHDCPPALAFYLGAALLSAGAALLCASVFSANEKVRSWFTAVLRGI